jgi:hypothetical protein
MRLRHLALLLLLAPACERGIPPAMSPVAVLYAPPPGKAEIVLIRPRSACDTSDYTVVVDDTGRFVANVAPGAKVSVHVAPGPSVLYAWSSRDVRSEKEPAFNPVAAIRVQAREDEAQYVKMWVPIMTATVTRCTRYDLVEMRHASRNEDFDECQPMQADSIAGQAELDATPHRVRAYLDLGRARLAMDDAARVHAHRRALESAEAR